MKNKYVSKLGFTLVELLAVIVILAIILAIAIPGISGIIKSSTKGAFESDAKMVLTAVNYKLLENDTFDPLTITKDDMLEKVGISGLNYSQATFSMVDNKLKVILVGTGKWAGLTAYGTAKNMKVVDSADYDEVPPVITLLGANSVTIGVGDTYADAGATATDLKDGNLTSSIVKTGTIDVNVMGTYTLTYNVSDISGNAAVPVTRTVIVESDYVTSEGVNKPRLITGMTPMKWNGSAWIATTAADVDWYNYTTADKQWANAQTADGSMWVWIPRYVYRISTGWHTSTAGVIDIQFSMHTDDTRGGTVTLDTGTTAAASNNKWTNHPAFTFGIDQLTGIWVAKFEASGTTSAVDIKPNVASLSNTSISNMFTAARNMETNSRYGWGTSGTNIDTHMMKNSEWGVVAYLAKSTYGKATEVSMNDNSSYSTGGGAYATNLGQSTTGNIYGIYDMAGGTWEYTAAYANNGNSGLAANGSSIMSANAKYKDVYTVTTDDSATNYSNALNKKGDAVYEISSAGTGTGWYGDYSYMTRLEYVWSIRGGSYSEASYGGIFCFSGDSGVVGAMGFRPVVSLGAGL